jgi:hypothetical protein
MNITIDSGDFNETVLDLLDSVTAYNLKQAREGLIHNYESAKKGKGVYVFVVGDHEADAAKIRKYIEAFDLIIDYYSINYEPYDFGEDK